ncbi:MAG: hypothetical protein JKX79_10520, partial [Labilibaculum sp.]|nr:hypothetical protein [Labilibaculum sp.]
MKNIFTGTLLATAIVLTACSEKKTVIEWKSTTEKEPWFNQGIQTISSGSKTFDVEIYTDKPLQTIDGFGSCFNELGWTSLSELDQEERDIIFRELYTPEGANFNVSRMPIGANDFSRDWYSYNETDGDFEMKNFSIQNDYETLIPFIKEAKAYNPRLSIFASPWSPPTWMKYNKHYALNSTPAAFGSADNGITEAQLGKEGTDMFIQEESYFEAYALYFKKFVEALKKEGIQIDMVMPQNEFNSAQWYPSCTWTPGGLTKFIRHLGPEMEALGVKVFFGTLERPNTALFEEVYEDSVAGKYIQGIGVQWAGKEAISTIHQKYPELKVYQSEHECGNGENNWAYAEYSWDLMKHYFQNGTNAYLYWNTSLLKGGISRWGWKQNSLISVDVENKTYTWNPEFYLMKHFSHYILPGAALLQTSSKTEQKKIDDVQQFWWKGNLSSNHDNLLAFRN